MRVRTPNSETNSVRRSIPSYLDPRFQFVQSSVHSQDVKYSTHCFFSMNGKDSESQKWTFYSDYGSELNISPTLLMYLDSYIRVLYVIDNIIIQSIIIIIEVPVSWGLPFTTDLCLPIFVTRPFLFLYTIPTLRSGSSDPQPHSRVLRSRSPLFHYVITVSIGNSQRVTPVPVEPITNSLTADVAVPSGRTHEP